ncbi:MAG: hypothetical protein K0R03_915 [Moraxellaceae bacterium]|jgi:hypothetical protein|nr:hypothetical protein [Moraxellaceae bacterium]
MWIKILVLIAMVAVLVNLFMALRHLMRGGQDSSRKALRALTWRLAISIAIFIGLFLAATFGIIAPHGLPQTEQAGPAPAQPPR